MDEVTVQPLPPERFSTILPPPRAEEWADALRRSRSVLGERTLSHVNSTAQGGGVAEMLQSLLGYLVCAGLGRHLALVCSLAGASGGGPIAW